MPHKVTIITFSLPFFYLPLRFLFLNTINNTIMYSKKHVINSLLGLLLLLFITPSFAQEQPSSFTLPPNIKTGGRMFYDIAYINASDTLANTYNQTESGARFFQFRFYITGKWKNIMQYKTQIGFQQGKPRIFDAFIQFNNIPKIGQLRIGQFVVPHRLVSLGSLRYNTFLIQSYPFRIAPKFSSGIMIKRTFAKKRLAAQLAYTFQSDRWTAETSSITTGDITARVSGLAIEDKANKHLLHLGLSYALRQNVENTFQVKAGVESWLTAPYFNTGLLTDIDHQQIVNAEIAYVKGPFSVQADIGFSRYTQHNTQYDMPVGYAYVSYLLTGESRPYGGSYNAFRKIIPHNDISNGIGAWEIALQYDYIHAPTMNMDVDGLGSTSFGINWYPNTFSRISLNYILTQLQANQTVFDKEIIQSIHMRFQIEI